MPPDRGAVRKAPSVKREPSKDGKPSTSRKVAKEVVNKDSKTSRTKPETSKSRDASVSRSKERVQKEDKLKVSSRDKLSSKPRIDSEKMRGIDRDVKKDISKLKESLAKNRASKDSRSISKPTSTPVRTSTRTSTSNSSNPLRSQLSYHTTSSRSSLDKSKVQSGKDLKKVSDSSSAPPPKLPSKERSSRKAEPRTFSTRTTVEQREPCKLKQTESSVKVQPKKLSRDRTRTRTLSPREVKISRGAPGLPPQEAALMSKIRSKPPSAVEPSVNLPQGHGDSAADIPSEDYDYEDDFEDYESDFEEDIESDITDEGAGDSVDGSDADDAEGESDGMDSDIAELSPRPVVEEEKKLDSGNYDLTDSKRRSKELQEVKEALERENSALAARERLKNQLVTQPTLAADEGFEEEKVEQARLSPVSNRMSFINFTNAKKRKQEQKMATKAKKRGEELLDMIRLDVMSYTLFDLAPVPYEVYMKSYGTSNTVQAHVQTNEDNLSQEVQTEPILTSNKWTQKPVTFRTTTGEDKASKDQLLIFSQDHLGVGGDSVEENPSAWKERMKVNALHLDRFLSTAGQAMLILLEEGNNHGGGKINNQSDLAFSDGYIQLGVDSVPFLAGRPITMLQFPAHRPTTLLTVHQGLDPKDESDTDALLARCMVCIWSVLEPSAPHKLLVASQQVTAVCFNMARANLVFGGLSDGSVCVWDLREQSAAHRVLRTDAGSWVLRSPTYSTAEILKEEGHLTEVVAVQSLASSDSNLELSDVGELSPTQVVSLEEAGMLLIWTVLQSADPGARYGLAQQDLGLAHWGRVRLVRTTVIDLEDCMSALNQWTQGSLHCGSLQLDSVNANHIYVGSNSGNVLHCLRSGGRPRPRLYTPGAEGYAAITCMESCPFGQPYFLVGCEEGTVRLHSQWSDQPLITLAGTGDALGQGSSVQGLQWSHVRPGMFFALDSSSRIHIWDLGSSDIHPIHSILLNKNVLAMQLSPDQGEGGKRAQHLAIATACGSVEIHQMKPDFCYQTPAVFKEDLEKFLLYTSAL